ncbi:ABC transporter permease [Thiobacillus sp.]|uniref:ABC transporter permease n=1 Tax=Thiobacillus sp. TaxID=924 RepID=UPI0025F9E015|nr:ABC transporter permease [Thiobacillus sp.]
MKCVAGLGFALLGSVAWAHEVKLETTRQEASVVRLSYADGQPFAFEAYELYVPGKATPDQVGRTTPHGQVVFLPGTRTEWRLKAYSADGHGVDEVIKVAAGAAAGVTPAAAELPRTLLLASGLGIVFGLFGIFQLFLRKRS